MITLGLSEAAALYVSLVLLIVAIGWWGGLFRRRSLAGKFNSTEYVRRCPYCTHVFVDYRSRELISCPVCESYFEGGASANTIT